MSEWISTTIGNVCDVVRNGCTNVQVEYISKYPVSRIETISNGVIDYEKIGYAERVSEEYLIQNGDILLSHINSLKHIGKIAIKKDSKVLYHGMNLLLLRVNKKYNRNIIFYILSNIKPYFEKIANSAINQASINQTEIQKTIIQIPILITEQNHIANILLTCDTVIEQTQSAISKYKAIKQGLLHDLFTRGLGADGKLRPRYQDAPELYKESELGWIPKEWEVKRLDEIGEVITGSTPSTLNPINYGDKYQFISPSDINGQQYILKSEKMLSDIGFSVSRKIPANSICLVCIGSTIGKSAMTSVESCTNQQINAIVPFDNKIALFYYYATKKYLMKQFAANMGLQAVPIVNKSTFQKFIIPIPNSQIESILIHNKLKVIDNNIQSEEALLQKYQKIKRGLMEDLLGGKKSIKLDNQN